VSKILVLIETDHEDRDEAIRSVGNALKRAGYDHKDYEAKSFGYYPTDQEIFGNVRSADALVEVCEPEVNRGAAG
jgi:hypothetical protein